MVEVTGAELVKWTNAYKTKREQRELEIVAAVLAAGGDFWSCAGRHARHDPDEDRAGRCGSVQACGSAATAGGEESHACPG